jgi:geranylgeranyl pyrophosphate synthase
MDAASAWLPARMAVVEDRLTELAGAYGPKLGEEAEATLRAGGKRRRPILVLMAAGDGAGERAIRAATAVELLHMATLVHDDVLDGAPVRRGRPTVVARAGRDRAVGVGDLLLSRAFAELADGDGGAEVAELSSASVALALGELAQRSDAYDTSISEERYLKRCS